MESVRAWHRQQYPTGKLNWQGQSSSPCSISSKVWPFLLEGNSRHLSQSAHLVHGARRSAEVGRTDGPLVVLVIDLWSGGCLRQHDPVPLAELYERMS
jgi:hypothetical protein